ncbi:MAG: hypothetical protein U5K77_01700 [Candidatus Saccharibacteria bacterium]|nr:hypothetical protein [Candidatus Saccharibacteria bacterium]
MQPGETINPINKSDNNGTEPAKTPEPVAPAAQPSPQPAPSTPDLAEKQSSTDNVSIQQPTATNNTPASSQDSQPSADNATDTSSVQDTQPVQPAQPMEQKPATEAIQPATNQVQADETQPATEPPGRTQAEANPPSWTPANNNQAGADTQDDIPAIQWSASEYVAHDKGAGWYVALGVISLIVAGGLYALTGDLITPIVIIVVAITFGVFAMRKPQVLNYQIDDSGITISQNHYPYEMFRTFTVQDEGGIESIMLMPLKRFMPGITIYFPPEQGDQIVETLANFLPHEDRPPDTVDKLMRKVRF